MRNPLTAAWDYLRGEDLKVAQPVLPTVLDPRAVDRKMWYDPITPAIRMGTLVHGPGATDAYEAAWGRGRDGNSAVFACLMALSLAHIEPPLRVLRRREPDTPQWLMSSPLQQLLDDPNPQHDAIEIRFWTQYARHLDGNAYVRKVRSGNDLTGNVVELWPISPTLIEPITTREDAANGVFISYYKYTYAPGKWDAIAPENMIHFRIGIDDRDHRKGLSPLKRLLREIASDDEATSFAEALLQNFGIPGLVVIPAKDSSLTLEQAQDLKERVTTEFRGSNRGKVGVISPGSDMKSFGFTPEQMNMEALHDVPETRIAAVMGVPPAVAGLGVGLAQTSNFASLRQVRENFTEVKLIPTWRMDGAKLDKQLKPDFSSEPAVHCEYDLTDVRALQEDEDAKYKRLDVGVQGYWIRPSEARTDVGLTDDPELDQLWLQRAAGFGGLPAVSNAAKLRRIIELKQGQISEDMLQALVELAAPGFADELEGYFDGARRRVKRALVSGQ